ncbi:MAG: hypothetical protein RLZZ408_1397 [Verrucomicrobiota bacterium]|jgi:hypothetical protein
MRPIATLTPLFVLFFAACSTVEQSRLNYYFPENTEYVQGIYRKFYNEKILAKTNQYPENEKLRNLRDAYRGDQSALRAFFNSPDRYVSGESGEAWHYDCFFLLISLGDDAYYNALAQEPPEIREQVGTAIDPQCNWQRDSFPKTRSLYTYRYQRTKPYNKP